MAENIREQDIEALVKQVVADVFNVDPNTITRETAFNEDLGADSLDLVEFIMQLEEKFDISIPQEEAEKVRTVGEVIDWLKQAVGQGVER